MLTFKQFISESAYTPSAISVEQFIEWCETHAPQYLARMSKNPIFRGFNAPTLGLIDTNEMNRRSANTANYYTVWMDNDKAWSDFPKRSKSLICSTSLEQASGFGYAQMIIPADINKIGVCSNSDLWDSFNYLKMHIGARYLDMNKFMRLTSLFLRQVYDSQILVKAQDNYTVLVDCLKSITLEFIRGAGKSCTAVDYTDYTDNIQHIIDTFESNNYKTLYDLWFDTMQPGENGFRLVDGAKMSSAYNVEVWVQGECATLNVDYMFDAINKNLHPLHSFCLKYNLHKMDT